MDLPALHTTLKSQLKGRVVNGTLTNVITEDELDSLFKELTPQGESDIVDEGGRDETIQGINDTSEDQH